MKVHFSTLLAAFAVLGLAAVPVAEAAPATPKKHSVRKNSAKKSGAAVTTQDVNGDGTPDVVVRTKPKPTTYPGQTPKPKSTGGVTVGN